MIETSPLACPSTVRVHCPFPSVAQRIPLPTRLKAQARKMSSQLNQMKNARPGV